MKEGLITVLLLKLDQSPTDPVLIHRIVEVSRIWRWCSPVLYMNALLTMLAGQATTDQYERHGARPREPEGLARHWEDLRRRLHWRVYLRNASPTPLSILKLLITPKRTDCTA